MAQTPEQQEIEMDKLMEDACMFGAGFLMMHSDGTMEHVPAKRVWLAPEEQPPHADT